MSSPYQINNKRIAKNTLVLYIRMLFLMLISLYTSRVILDALGIEDYGIYNVVGGFVAMFSIISSSLSGSASRFLNYEMGKGNKESLNSVFCTTVSIQILLATIIVLLSECIGVWYINNVMVLPAERLTAANWCFQFSVATFCISLLAVPYNAAITAHERMKAFAYVSIFEGIAKLLVCYLIMISPIDRLISYSFLLLCISIIVRLSYQMYCKKNFEECRYHWLLDKDYLKQILSYSTWHLFGNSSVILKDHGVNLIINLFFGPAVNAARGISTQMLHAVKSLASNFMTAIRPQITQSYAKGDIGYMFKLVYKGSIFSYLVILLISLPLLLNTHYLLDIWLKETPQYAVIFSQLSIIIALIDTLSRSLIYAQDATGNIRNYQIVIGGILLLNLPVCYIFLWWGYSPVSVMYVSICLELLALAARMVMIPRYIPEFNPIDYILKVVGKCIFITVVSVALPLSLKFLLSETLFSFITISIVSILCTSTSIYYLGCNKNERLLIRSKVNTVVKKIKK